MNKKLLKYLSIYCLISNIFAPLLYYLVLILGYYIYSIFHGIFEYISIILNIGMIIFPFLFIYQIIRKEKDIAYKISKISLVIFILQIIIRGVLFFIVANSFTS